MKKLLLSLVGLCLATSVVAGGENLVEEKQVMAWGYKTVSRTTDYDYRSVNKLEGEISLKHQLIKSIKPIEGKKGYYHYYEISEECFSSKPEAQLRKFAFGFRNEKDFRLGKVSGNCVRIINTGAKMDTYKEQPRVFGLFNEYMDNKLHNTVY